MADIFISYASEDRSKARELADILVARGFSVWWDRKIPLGKSFDEVIETALRESRCVVVLWSKASVASEWVRNESAEAKRREILVPVFIESVDAPLAFRLLNGANLSDWYSGLQGAEFDKLIERISELVASIGTGQSHARPVVSADGVTTTAAAQIVTRQWFRSPLVLTGIVACIAVAGLGGYFFAAHKPPQLERDSLPAKPIEKVATPSNPIAGLGDSDMEKAIGDLAKAFGGAVPAASLATGFHVPDLGARFTYLTAEQSASTLGSLPPGAVVLEVQSEGPLAKAGIHAGDVVLAIAGMKIASEEKLREAIRKVGAGKTEFIFRRDNRTRTVAVECSGCNEG